MTSVVIIECSTVHALFSFIFLPTVRRIRMFFNLKHPISQGESSLKISARWGSPFRRIYGTNKQTHRLTNWHPIALVEHYDKCFVKWLKFMTTLYMVSNIYCIYDLNVTNLIFLSDSEPVSSKNLCLPHLQLDILTSCFFI